MEKIDAAIWVVQADHLSGESLGAAIQRVLELGATNVQIIPSITKKNRPGHVLLIDVVHPSNEERIEEFLKTELGVYGYHRLKTDHFFERTSSFAQKLTITGDAKQVDLNVEMKIMSEEGGNGFAKLEHASALAIQEEIDREFGKRLSLREITSLVEGAVRQRLSEVSIDLRTS